MSGLVCYLGRADRGDRLVQVRLVGAGSEQVWEGSPAADDPAGVLSQAAEAAAWVAQRARESGGEVGLLCLDVDGATCGWLTAPSTDPDVVAAAMAQGSAWGGDGQGSGPWAPATVADSSLQALAAPTKTERRSLLPRRGRPEQGADAGERLAVLAVPDVLGRVFTDDLDDRGVSVGRAVSLWHAMAMAWDPAGPRAGDSLRGGGEVVATSETVTAVVLIDPAGRLVWCWSVQGELMAGGTIRLAADRGEDGPAVRIGAPEVARLTADWLSWTVQLGRAPQRIVCLGPETGGNGAADVLTPAALGAALGQSWPGATVDLAVHDDPVGATLARLAARPLAADPGDPRRALVGLSGRPGRVHRSAYRWASLAVLAMALALLGVGWKAWGAASSAKEARVQARAAMVDTATTLAPPGSNQVSAAKAADTPRLYLEEQLRSRRQSLDPTGGLDPAKPILAELETLSFVLGTSEIQIDSISLMSAGVTLYLWVPDTATGEAVKSGLDSVSNSMVEWGPLNFSPTGRGKEGMKSVSILGQWKQPAGRRPGASASAGGRP